MLGPSHSLLRYLRRNIPYRSSQCQFVARRAFSCAPALNSGHSRWSTIKHDKAKNDAAKNKKRSVCAHELELASKLYGPDPDANPRLKTAIAEAKRQRFPKESIEAAVRRGQGLSTTGKPLESVTVEAVFPPGVAAIIECQTESKLRTLTEVRSIITKSGGQASPTQYLFDRRGKIVFQLGDVAEESLFECALEQEGVLDVVNDVSSSQGVEDRVAVVLTEPNATKAVADAIVQKLQVNVQSLKIEWQPNTLMDAGEDDVLKIQEAVDKLEEINEVQDVYLNM